MKFYIGNTDLDWYNYLKEINPEDINFWQPGGSLRFRAIESGAPFLFRLKSPVNQIAGVGFFTSHSFLPIDFAWEVFQDRNGTNNYHDFYNKIKTYKGNSNSLNANPNIGCIVLTNPLFFDEKDWIPIPENWSQNIVQGKTYNTENALGNDYWNIVEAVIKKYSTVKAADMAFEPAPLYKTELTNIRIGQGAFRVLVTDAYSRRCAISGEKTLPVLEAAHIKPYSTSGPNITSNGLLLRSDLHKLFDKGYITVTDKLYVEISQRIKEEFENGRDYYKYHGHRLASVPANAYDFPEKTFLRWHNENVFRF